MLTKKSASLIVAFVAKQVLANYDPSSGEDWTQLSPDCPNLAGSFDTLPFKFGIVVNPYHLNEEGEYEEPPLPTVTRSITKTYESTIVTTFTTSTSSTLTTSEVHPAPKPTKTSVIHQINDGQIQNPEVAANHWFDPPCEEEEEEDDCDDDGGHEDDCDDSHKEDDCDDSHEEDDCDDSHVEDDCDEDGFVKREEEDCEDEFVSPVYAVACATKSTLHMTLQDSILRDDSNRIGSIVGSRQFQFDGPVPQYGAIYAAGWSVTSDGQLALGGSTTFFQCASGGFFNLYDQNIAEQCSPVTLDVVELIDCGSPAEEDETCEDEAEDVPDE